MPVVREFTVDYVFQDQWGLRGRNTLLMLAIYFGGIGGGFYLVALLAGYSWGMLLGVLLAAVAKSATHIGFLGRPERFWRAGLRPHSSWISRGFVFFGLFVLSGLGYVLPQFDGFTWLPWKASAGFGLVLYWLSIITGFLTITYTGFLLNRTAVRFWNNSLLPALFMLVSVWSGASLSGFFLHFVKSPGVNTTLIKEFSLWGGVATLVLLLIYYWGGYNFDLASRRAVQSLAINRGTAWLFYGLFIVVGLSFPVAVYAAELIGGVNEVVLLLAEAVEVVVGALLFRYTFFRGGVFLPVY